jgi:hypothetical protein
MKQLHEKLPEFELPLETPRGQYPDVQVSMTEIFRDAKAADDFAEVERSVSANLRSTSVTTPSLVERLLPQSTDQATQS